MRQPKCMLLPEDPCWRKVTATLSSRGESSSTRFARASEVNVCEIVQSAEATSAPTTTHPTRNAFTTGNVISAINDVTCINLVFGSSALDLAWLTTLGESLIEVVKPTCHGCYVFHP